jgi:membrane protein
MAKGFNLYARLRAQVIEPFLDSTFGERSSGAAAELRRGIDEIFAYVERTDLSALGTVAFLFVFYSVLKLLGAIEGSLNDIWGVKRARTLLRRVSDYLAIVVVAPVFLLSATALTAWIKGSEVVATGAPGGAAVEAPAAVTPVSEEALVPMSEQDVGVRLLPLLAVWLGFSFVYKTLPNTRVSIGAALLGGALAGSIWQAIQILHLEGQIELGRYNTIYSTFAAFPMLLLWIHLSWSVFLVGAELAFAHQNESAFTSMARTGKVDQRFEERIAPRLAGRIAHAFLGGKPAPSVGALAGELGVAPRTVLAVLESLCQANLLARTSVGADDGYLPARDPDTITVMDLLTALRREEGASEAPVRGRLDERVDRVLDALDEENRRSLSNYTLRELAETVAEGVEERPSAGGAPRPAEA